MKLTEKTLERFESRSRELDKTTFAGVNVPTRGSDIHLDQHQYILRIPLLHQNSTFSEFRSIRTKAAWGTHTRPDISCSIAIIAQVTKESFSSKSIKIINKIVNHLRNHPNVSLKYQPLDLESLRIQVCSDAAFANPDDLKSQLKFITLLVDKTNRCHILHFSS